MTGPNASTQAGVGKITFEYYKHSETHAENISIDSTCINAFAFAFASHRTAPHRTAPHRTAPQRTATHRNAPHRTAPHRTAPHRTAPHRTAPHRTAPHRTAPHRTAPHRTAPHKSDNSHDDCIVGGQPSDRILPSYFMVCLRASEPATLHLVQTACTWPRRLREYLSDPCDSVVNVCY